MNILVVRIEVENLIRLLSISTERQTQSPIFKRLVVTKILKFEIQRLSSLNDDLVFARKLSPRRCSVKAYRPIYRRNCARGIQGPLPPAWRPIHHTAELKTGNLLAVHLIRAVGEPESPHSCPHIGQHKLLAHGSTTVQLHGPVDNTECHVGRGNPVAYPKLTVGLGPI